MAKPRKRKSRRNVQPGELPTPEQLARGSYERKFITHAESNTKAMGHVNTGGTPLARWESGGKLDSTQLAVILSCLECWRLAGLSQSVTALYGERVGTTSDAGENANAVKHAKDTLTRYRDYFPGRTKEYFDIFENIIRHNMPAGVAGAVEGFDKKAATTRSLTIVRMVCDTIASRERFGY